MLRDAGVVVDDLDEHAWRVEPGPLDSRTASDRAGPVQRRAVPRRRRGDRRPGRACPAGRARPPRPATRCATCSTAWAPTSTLDRDGPDRRRAPAASSGVDVDLHDVGELDAGGRRAVPPSPTVPLTLRGIAHLRGHETDRLAALATRARRPRRRRRRDRRRAGDPAAPAARRRGSRTYDDHRMATPAAVLGLRRARRARRETSRRRPRRCPASPSSGPGCSGDRRAAAPASPRARRGRRPGPAGRRASRPRTKERPQHDDATPQVSVVTVDRGRYTCRVDGPTRSSPR